MSELPVGWAKAPVDDLRAPEPNSITDGPFGSKLKSSHYVESGPHVVRLGNVGAGRFLDDEVACISKEHFASLSKHHVSPGDIVVAALGDPLPRACLIPAHLGPALVKADCFRLKPSKLIDTHYIMNWFNSEEAREHFSTASHGLGRIRVNLSDLKDARVPIPPLSEQRRIVAKIDSLSAKSKRARDRLDYVPRLVARYKEALLDAAYDSALAQGGTELPLGKLASEVRNGLSKKPSDQPPGLPILRISAVRPGRVVMEARRYYPEDGSYDPEAVRLRHGDLLFTRYNGNPDFVAVCGMVSEIDETVLYPDKLIRVRVQVNLTLPSYVERIVNSRRFRITIQHAIKTAAGQHGISGSDLKMALIPVPSLAVQAGIVRGIETAFAWIDRLAAEATSARGLIDRLDQAILAKAFRGELVPQAPADEPASVLLERIRAERAGAPAAKRRGRPRAPA